MASTVPLLPPGTRLPDYNGGSILNLVSSIEARFGGGAGYPQLDLLPAGELDRARTVILLVIDGMGHGFFQRHTSKALVKDHCLGSITSVFPSTTAAAMTTLHTGLAPARHGILAWFTYLKELGEIAIFPPALARRTGVSLGMDVARQIINTGSMFQRARCTSHVVVPKEYIDSPYTSIVCAGAQASGYKSFQGLMKRITRIARRGKGEQLVIGYWPRFDGTCHVRGPDSPEAIRDGKAVLEAVEQLVTAPWLGATGTTVIVTADHGQVTTPISRIVRADVYQSLQDALVLPLSGEARAAFCHVRHGREARFHEALAGLPQGCCTAIPAGAAIEAGWFGPATGGIHKRLHDRAGDYILLMHGDHAIKDILVGEARDERGMIGHHGGTSEDEMLVPLIASR